MRNSGTGRWNGHAPFYDILQRMVRQAHHERAKGGSGKTLSLGDSKKPVHLERRRIAEDSICELAQAASLLRLSAVEGSGEAGLAARGVVLVEHSFAGGDVQLSHRFVYFLRRLGRSGGDGAAGAADGGAGGATHAQVAGITLYGLAVGLLCRQGNGSCNLFL